MSRIPQKIAEQILTIQGEQFFIADQEQLKAMRQVACEHDLEGLAIACPDTVRDNSFPVVLLNARRSSRNQQVGGYLNYLLVTSPMARGRASVAPYFSRRPPGKKPRPAKPPPPPPWPEPGEDEATITGVTLEQAGDRLQLPDRGTVAAWVIGWDWVSNRALVRLERPGEEGGGSRRYHLDQALALHRRAEDAADGGDTPRYGSSDASPRLEGPGAALALAERWPADQPSLLVHGTVCQELDAGCVVVDRWREPAADLVDGEPPPDAAELPRAMISASVIVVNYAQINVQQLDVTMPIYAADPLQPGQQVEGSFVLDLAALQYRVPGPAMVWLVAGELLAGPFPLLLQ